MKVGKPTRDVREDENPLTGGEGRMIGYAVSETVLEGTALAKGIDEARRHTVDAINA